MYVRVNCFPLFIYIFSFLPTLMYLLFSITLNSHSLNQTQASIAVHAVQREENERTLSPTNRSDHGTDLGHGTTGSASDSQLMSTPPQPSPQSSTTSQSSLDSIINDLTLSPNKASTAQTANRLMKSKNRAKVSLLGRRSNSMGEHSDSN